MTLHNSTLMVLEDSVYFEPNTGCWLWGKYTNPSGYGNLRYDGRIQYAHRVSYEHYYGDIPLGHHVCHKCDVPSCVNPSHLFLGTPRDNILDSYSKKRRSTGAKHAWAKIDDKVIASAVSLLVSGWRPTDVARLYGLKTGTVSALKCGRLRSSHRGAP